MTDSIKASEEGLAIVDCARQRKGWTKTRSMRWWSEAHVAQATLRRFWRRIPIQRENFIAICEAVGISNWEGIAEIYELDLPEIENNESGNNGYFYQDWREAPDISSFYGRTEEINQLEQWIVTDSCKLVALLGLGGIGKTSLAVALADRIQDRFDCLIWRSLKSEMPLHTLLNSLLKSLSPKQESISSDLVQQGISYLITALQNRRCLLILDEAEAIFRSHEGKLRPRGGQYQAGYEDYGELFRRLGSERHQSCILLTSREKPEEIAAFEGKTFPVHSLLLKGLEVADAKEIFTAKGFSDCDADVTQLIELYRGNPLALKVITTMIQEVFNGNIANFLKQNTLVVGDRIRTLLTEQFSRISDLEKEVVNWLMLAGEPISLSGLRTKLLFPPTQSILLEVLVSLERRCLIDKATLTTNEDIGETSEVLFTLQPLVMKYAMEEFIEQAIDEIDAVLETEDIDKFKVLKNHLIIQPESLKDIEDNLVLPYVTPRILTRFKDSLRGTFRCDDSAIGQELSEILPLLPDKSSLKVGYVGRNLWDILKSLGFDVDSLDWQDIPMG